jgi:hypothetical protein
MSAMHAQARSAGREATHSRAFEVVTRLGFLARGAIYVIVGVLAIQVASHTTRNTRTDQRGAMEVIDHQPFGHWLLVVVAVGLGGYAAWRFVQAYAGHGPEGGGDHTTMGRIAAAGSGCAYAILCVLAITILIGGSSSSSNTHKQTAGVLGWPGGQWLVGAAGVIFVGVALFQAYKGISRKFLDEDKTEQMGETTLRVLTAFGVVGYLARTVAFGLIGIFLIRAAIDFNPHQAVGLDGALARVAHHQFGTLLLGLVAAGLIAFGLYSIADARYRRI